MLCTELFNHFFPLGLGMPSAFSVFVMSRVLLPWAAMSKIRRINGAAFLFTSSRALFLAPSCT